MAVTLKVTGNGDFAGSATNLTSYTVSEDSTPIIVSDTSGGTGTLQFEVVENAQTPYLLNDTVELIDDSNGRTTGTVDGVGATNTLAQISANSRVNLFMFETTTKAFTGTLLAAFTYYFGLAGITSGYTIDATLTQTVTFPGFTGNLWEFMKQLCASQNVEISLVSGNIIVRKLRTRTLETKKVSSVGWSIDNIDLAQNIEIYSYESEYRTNGMMYPPNGWNEDMQIIQADANEVVTVEIPLDASLVSVEQPTAVASVSRTYSGPSVYAVSGNDGLPIQPAQWEDYGGYVTVSIGPDTRTLIVKMKGMRITKYAPYRLAMSSGSSEYYSSIRIRGTGVVFDKQLITIPTGVPNTKTAQDVGITVDSPFIQNVGQAMTVGAAVAGSYSMPTRTLSVNATVVNRKNDKGTANYPTFATFDATYAGQTFAQFDTAWAGQTFAQFDAAQLASVQDDFDNQAFGNVAGGRMQYRNNYYRVRSASITPGGIDFNAEDDTIFSDFDATWAGKTFADFDTSHSGRTFADFSLGPLWQ